MNNPNGTSKTNKPISRLTAFALSQWNPKRQKLLQVSRQEHLAGLYIPYFSSSVQVAESICHPAAASPETEETTTTVRDWGEEISAKDWKNPLFRTH